MQTPIPDMYPYMTVFIYLYLQIVLYNVSASTYVYVRILTHMSHRYVCSVVIACLTHYSFVHFLDFLISSSLNLIMDLFYMYNGHYGIL